MEQEGEESGQEGEHAAEYWRPKFDALHDKYDQLSECTMELYKAGRISKAESIQVFRAFNETAIYRSGSTGRKDDALSYGLYRDGLHQMRRTLFDLRPELRTELEAKLPEGPAR